MKVEEKIDPKGISYELPDGKFVNILESDSYPAIQAGQIVFWMAWANHWRHGRPKSETPDQNQKHEVKKNKHHGKRR
jgi:hypothetical protein